MNPRRRSLLALPAALGLQRGAALIVAKAFGADKAGVKTYEKLIVSGGTTDLTLEKQWLLERLHAGGGEPAKFQFTLPPTDEDLARLEAPGDANPRLAARA